MFRRTVSFLYGRLSGSSPFKPVSRLSQNQRNAGLDVIEDPIKYQKKYGRDPAGFISGGHVILKQCPFCERTKLFHISERTAFHTCCEGYMMRETGTMKSAVKVQDKLEKRVRQFDFQNMTPLSGRRKPHDRTRSKFKKGR